MALRLASLVAGSRLGRCGDPIDAAIWSSKLGLLEILKALDEKEYAHTVLRARMRDVAAGADCRGLCAETLDLWTKAGKRERWSSITTAGKAKTKTDIKAAVSAILAKDWANYQANGKICADQTHQQGKGTAPRLGYQRRNSAHDHDASCGLHPERRTHRIAVRTHTRHALLPLRKW